LGTDDLASGLRSILDSTRIEAIADEQLQFQGGRAQRRDWIADPLQVILTLSNLRGVPYSVDQANAGSFEERIASHADRIEFAIGSGFTDFATLRLAAMATGAFPLMLASRAIMRAKADYQNLLKIAPDWGGPAPDRFPNVYADGGITNNNPFQCAHDALVAAAGNIGQNPRDPANANAAVISVAPFPGDERFDASYDPAKESALVNVAAAVAHTLISQTRFQGEDLLLTRDESVSSRFAIAPSDDTAGDRPALLCGSLGAFGGFVDQKFRDRDYQLGRYNCQEFLRRVFAVTADNVIVGPGAKKKPEMQAAFDAEYSFVEDGKRWYPVIPLMPGLRQKIALPGRDAFKTSDERLEQVASAAANRLRAVLHAVLREPWLFLEGAIFDLGGSHKVKGLILEKLKNELGRVGQI
jgi:hypothetical protein